MDYGQYLNTIFPGIKVQKISVNAGFSCPNRDGKIGTGGCIYCRNDSFSPAYCMNGDSLRAQIEKGKYFFGKKYPDMKFLVYFQSYTNSYGQSIDRIIKLYNTALECKDVVGLVIGTRPDTLENELLDYLGCLNSKTPVFLEIGAETSSDITLELINRHHTWLDVVTTVNKVAEHHLHCGLHLIAGLPGEDEIQILTNVKKACELPIETLKLHQLQILHDTPLFMLWQKGEINVRPFELDEYLDLCLKIFKLVPPHIVIERFLSQSPPNMVEAPKWGLKNYQFMNLLKNKIQSS